LRPIHHPARHDERCFHFSASLPVVETLLDDARQVGEQLVALADIR
jgi:hypothetical protein